MFDALSDRLQNVFQNLKGHGKLTAEDIDAAMREIRLALLEADVNFKVVREFVAHVKERALGAEVMESLTPAQQVIKIVNEELTALMGVGRLQARLQRPRRRRSSSWPACRARARRPPAPSWRSTSRRTASGPVLIAADVYRPAAIDQLQTLGERVGVPVYAPGADLDPVDIARDGVEFARANGDVAIIDTAGRLHIDDELMDELARIRSTVKPHNILLVVDAMTGQDAVNAAEEFRQKVDLDGVVLTKLDGDARGGAALSVRAVTGRPIKFASIGEKLDDFDTFHPDRMASRILGMGDVLTLIEKAEDSLDAKKAAEMEDKLRRAEFTFEDFLEQLKQVRKMGSLSSIIGMLPGVPGMKELKNVQVDDRQLDRIEAMIFSMTPRERRNPELIDGRRKQRIARGSGTTVQDVNVLLKQYREMQKMLKMFSSGKMKGCASRAWRLPGMSSRAAARRRAAVAPPRPCGYNRCFQSDVPRPPWRRRRGSVAVAPAAARRGVRPGGGDGAGGSADAVDPGRQHQEPHLPDRRGRSARRRRDGRRHRDGGPVQPADRAVVDRDRRRQGQGVARQGRAALAHGEAAARHQGHRASKRALRWRRRGAAGC